MENEGGPPTPHRQHDAPPLSTHRLGGPQQRVEPLILVSLLVLGLLCTALALPIAFALIKEVGASRATTITYVNPAVSVLLGVFVLGEPLTIAIVAGFLLIIAGSWLSVTGSLPLTVMRHKAKPELPTPEMTPKG